MTDTYGAIAAAGADQVLGGRVAACAAQQAAAGLALDPPDPSAWSWTHRLTWAASPGWGAAWDSALAAGTPEPGQDPAVITDGMILSAVQAMLTVSAVQAMLTGGA